MDYPVLKYLDVFIGLAFVMLLGCTVVAAVTQVVTSGVYLRAQYLRQGLADLLKQIDPKLDAATCTRLAQLIQRHPAVARQATYPGVVTARIRNYLNRKFIKDNPHHMGGPQHKECPGPECATPISTASPKWLPDGAPAIVIQRHEFLGILLGWAAGVDVFAKEAALKELTAKVKHAVNNAGVTSPEKAYEALQFFALQQERSNPGLASHLWHTAAAIDACPASFVGRIHSRYDSMTSRISQRFALQAKLIGSLVALGVALYLPLDSVELIQRLSADSKYRDNLVDLATMQASKHDGVKHDGVKPDAGKATVAADTNDYLTRLDKVGIIRSQTECFFPYVKAHWKGLALSWILLSLGAPFWYDALKNAVGLRSMLAKKDDQDKADRQRSEVSPAGSTAQPAPPGVVPVVARPA